MQIEIKLKKKKKCDCRLFRRETPVNRFLYVITGSLFRGVPPRNFAAKSGNFAAEFRGEIPR